MPFKCPHCNKFFCINHRLPESHDCGGSIHFSHICYYCKNIELMPFKCPQCNKFFCINHRLPESHDCRSLEVHPYNNGQRIKKSPRRRQFPIKSENETEGTQKPYSPPKETSPPYHTVKESTLKYFLNEIHDAVRGIFIVLIYILLLVFIVFQIYAPLAIEHTSRYFYEYSPPINDPANIHDKFIQSILDITDKEIVRNINSINVVYDINSLRSKCQTSIGIGCANSIYVNSIFLGSDIYVIDSGYWLRNSNSNSYACGSFEFTLNHEIGHVHGFMISDNSETHADEYANKHTKTKGLC